MSTYSILIDLDVKTVSLHFTLKLEGLKDLKWMKMLYGFLHGINWMIFHGLLDFVTSPPKRVRSNTKPIEHGTPKSHNN